MNFKEQMAKDLDDVFFNTDEFAVLATFRGVEIAVDFKEKDDVVFDSGQDSLTDISASVPSVLCKSVDVADAQHGEEFMVNNVTYYIIDMDPSADGTRKLYLSEDRP